jgi:hypothetical protein
MSFMAFYRHMDVPQFIHSPTEGNFGCFQVLATLNKAATGIYVHIFVQTLVSTFGGK